MTLRDASRALLVQTERESEESIRGAMGTFRSAAVALDKDEEEEEEKKRREVERLPPLLEDEVSLIDRLIDRFLFNVLFKSGGTIKEQQLFNMYNFLKNI